jgi:His/Glu/Gln/Arg/opine family amino acid ABC transporter permease subunit
MEFDLHVLRQWAPALSGGFLITLGVVALSLLLAIGLGLLACLGSLTGRGLVFRLSRWYVDFFRVIPDVVLIFWVYFCFPPVFGLRLSATASGVLALALGTGAFLAEVFRAGVLAVPRGQIEAALALGIPGVSRWRQVILPQAVRRMMPAFVNTITDLLKHSSLLAGITVGEMTYVAYTIGAQTFRYVEPLTAVAIAYFAVIFPLSLYVRRAEAHAVRRTGQ